MKPYGLDVVNLGAQVRGYAAAVERFRSAAAGQDAVAAYQPLFESLSWAASLDFRIADIWAPEGKALGKDWHIRASGAEALPGLRWARNTVHHDWANALSVDTEGRRYPKRYPVRYFEWIWRDAAELPPNRKTTGRDVYSKLLADQPAEFTLYILGEVFRFVADVIEPPLPSAGRLEGRPSSHGVESPSRLPPPRHRIQDR